MLPADDRPLAERMEALAQWCASLLAGYARQASGALPSAETGEILRDLTAIASAETELDDSETNEADYTQLLEFARVAALLLLATQPADNADAKPPTH